MFETKVNQQNWLYMSVIICWSLVIRQRDLLPTETFTGLELTTQKPSVQLFTQWHYAVLPGIEQKWDEEPASSQ